MRRESQDRSPERLPVRDVTFHSSGSMSLSGRMLRYVRAGSYWDAHLGELRERTYIAVFDGETAQSHHTDNSARKQAFPLVGFIKKEILHPERGNDALLPTLMTFRPCDPNTGGIDLTQYRISSSSGTIEGTPCVILEEKAPSGNRRDFWLDPRRDFIVRRMVRTYGAAYPDATLDISYRQDSSSGWTPSGWRLVTQGGAPAVREQRLAKVTRTAINEEVPQSAFHIDFPPGTIVRNLKTGDNQLVKEDGESRAITKQEIARGAKYEEYLKTDSGTAGLNHTTASRLPRQALILATIIAGVVAAGIACARFRRARQAL